MRFRFSLTTVLLMVFLLSSRSQLLRMSSPHTAFPDTGRIQGHVYDSVLYDATAHYTDSNVLILVPDRLPAIKKLDLVFWFHGWRNNIDTAIAYYHLADQFLASNRNAVLVLAETAKNSPDSYGGKLENPAVFKALVNDVLVELKKRNKIGAQCETGNILLAGHSGAYRVIARILTYGEVKIREVLLFDALYGERDLFDQWLRSDTHNRLINWFTDEGGGTDEESIKMMDQLKKEGLTVYFRDESSMSVSDLSLNRIIFLHSKRAHNDIIFNPDNFRMMLETSPFLKALPK
ncbi:MAG TPA: hypothetical protein VK543_04990 [Puia sp.]|nr:hypothetical protein [Puia sp.]